MRGLILTAVIVLLLCVITFYFRPSISGPTISPPVGDQYSTAINAAKGASQVHGFAERQRWAAQLQLSSIPTSDRQFSTDGTKADTLVVSSDTMSAFDCSGFAKSENGVTAVNLGFKKVTCQDRMNRMIYYEDLEMR